MKRLLPLLVLALSLSSARAELLLYDGFATETDAQSRTPYLSSSDTHKLQSDNAKGEAWTTGVSKNYPWSDSSAVVFTFRNNGLSLPSIFAEGTGEQFSKRGGSVGWLNNSYSAEIRGKNRKITSTMPTSGKLYYRCLMKIEANAFARMKEATDRYAAAGLSFTAAANAYNNGYTLAQTGFRVYFIGTGSTVALKFGVGKGNGNGTIANTLVDSVTAGTTYLCIIGIDYDTGKACAYASPVNDYDKHFTWTTEDVDASGITGSAVQTMFIDGIYQTNNGRILVDEIAAGTALSDVAVWSAPTFPKLLDGSLALANGTYTATALLTNSAASVSYVLSNGTTATTNAIGACANGDTVSATFAAPADDTTYEVLLVAANQGGETDELSLGTIYGGTLSLAKVSDAAELGVAAAMLTVSRANDDPLPLVVNYSFADGTAVAGVNYVDDAGSVTIPAGQASATIAVHPLVDVATTTDTTMTVSVAAGNYTAPAAGVAVTIANFTTPAGLDYWLGTTATDGEYLASTDDNWSQGRAPLASETVVLDGDFSTVDCTWDAAAPHMVGGWLQTNGYTGSVVFKTTFAEADASFTEFTITGNATIAAGNWTVPTAASGQTARHYRIKVSVGGTLEIAGGASVTVSGKGPWPAAGAVSYGGQADTGTAYGNVLEPADPGSGWPIPGGASGEYNHPAFGGGAIWIEVAGATTLDGDLLANGGYTKGWDHYYGSGGGIYLKTASLSGAGSVSADGNSTGGSNGGCASAGGRISILLTGAADMSLPLANVHALGSSEYGHQGGAGTIVLRSTSLEHGRLVVRNLPAYGQYKYYPLKERTTPVLAGETWTFDEIVFGENGVLRVPAGATLSLPNGLASVSGSSALSAERTSCGILLDGGTLDIADTAATEHVVGNGQWMLSPNAPLTLNGNLTVQGGAAVGAIHVRNAATNSFNKMDLTVKGDMTVAADGYILTEGAGLNGTDAATLYAGTTYGSHGGAFGASSDTAAPSDVVYDSILSPSRPGNRSNVIQRYSSGVAILTVEGVLVLNGTASANAVSAHWGGGAGSLNIVAGSLSGSGTITANGNEGNNWDADNNYHMYPGGGRVSVRLTDAGATFSGHWVSNILARGVAWNAGNGTRLHHSTAGTVYLQAGGRSEGVGAVRIFQNNAAVNWTTVCTNDFTAFPSTRHGGENDDLRRVALEIGGGAHAFLTKDARIDSLSVENHSTLNLHGREFVVTTARLADGNVRPGTYTAAQLQALGFAGIVDTADGAGGTLRVLGAATVIIVK